MPAKLEARNRIDPIINNPFFLGGGGTNGEILFFSPNDVTIDDMVAGEEYTIHMLAESAFGRNSSQLTFVRSLYTDDVTVTNTFTTHTLKTDVVFDSGVGATVEVELECHDFPLTWKLKKTFEWVLSLFLFQ